MTVQSAFFFNNNFHHPLRGSTSKWRGGSMLRIISNLIVVVVCALALQACGQDRPNPGPGPGPITTTLQITTTTLPEGIVGEVYHAQIKVEGGTPPDALTGEGI